MKQLIIILAVILLAACNKPTPPTLQSDVLYYRIQQVDLDGTVTYTPVRKIKTEPVANSTSDDDEDEDDEECDDDDHLPPLAIDFTTFTVRNVKNGIQIYWEASEEQNTSHYIIERSIDIKNWTPRLNYIPDYSGKYTVTDKF
jgi:hypothetical protein